MSIDQRLGEGSNVDTSDEKALAGLPARPAGVAEVLSVVENVRANALVPKDDEKARDKEGSYNVLTSIYTDSHSPDAQRFRMGTLPISDTPDWMRRWSR